MNQKPCTFCRKEGIQPPAMGSKATGCYASDFHQIRNGEFYQPTIVFNGYVCEMHAKDVEWIRLKWKREKSEFTYGEFDNGKHWKGEE